MIDSWPQASMEDDDDELLNVHYAKDNIIRDDDNKMDANDAKAKPEVLMKSKLKNIEALLQKVNFFI